MLAEKVAAGSCPGRASAQGTLVQPVVEEIGNTVGLAPGCSQRGGLALLPLYPDALIYFSIGSNTLRRRRQRGRPRRTAGTPSTARA